MKRSHAIPAILVALLLAVAAGAAWCIFRLPMSSGPFSVGVQSADWPLNGRLIAVDIFYPAEPASRWQRLVSVLGLNPGRQRGNAVRNAQPASAAQRFPVLLYAHGWNGSNHENRYLLEQLSSLGYVVVAPDDPQVSPHVVYSDGHSVHGAATAFLEFTSADALSRSQARVHALLQSQVEMYRALTSHILAHAAELPPLAHAAPERIGMLGYSFGGSIATETCRRDPRLLACVNLDGYGTVLGSQLPLRQPLLWVNSSMSPTVALPPPESLGPDDRLDEQDMLVTVAALQHTGALVVELIPTLHQDFTDDGQQSPWHRLHRSEPARLRGSRLRTIVSSLLGAFFDQHLRSSGDGALAVSHRYPEIRVLFADGHSQSGLSLSLPQAAPAAVR